MLASQGRLLDGKSAGTAVTAGPKATTSDTQHG